MYFELDDIQRRHSLYFDSHNIGGWVKAPDSTFSWNYERGAIIGVTSMMLNEYIKTFAYTCEAMLNKFEPPKGIKQISHFAREVVRTDYFKQNMRTRAQYAFAIGMTDMAARISAFRWINNGWQKPSMMLEINFARKIPGTIFIAALTAPISVPFEYAKIAYYADKTFPEELQKGYKSYFNALRRIPFEEGPYYLFKGSAPFIVRNFFQTLTLFYSYDYIKDKLMPFARENRTPYVVCKTVAATLATLTTCAASSPLYLISRYITELYPSSNGKHLFDHNYRKALVSVWFGEFRSTFFNGFAKYSLYNAPWMISTLMLCDSLGIFTYWYTDMTTGAFTNTIEDSYS